MQAITAWLSCWDKELRDKLINIAPEVLIEFGDPSLFPIAFRLSILDALILQYQGQQDTDLHLDIAMMKRLASPEMAEAINSRLNENSSHNDLCEMFLAMIWHGEVKGSVKEAIKIAQSNDFKKRLRVTALRTILSVGTEEQKQGIIAELLCQQEIGKKILGTECSRLFPNYLSVNELMQVISAYPKKEKFRRPTIHYHLESIAKQ